MRASDSAVSMQDGVDVTIPVSLLAAAGSNSSAQFTAAARSIIVAIAANRSADVASAVGAVVITADAANNTQASLAILAQQGHAERLAQCTRSMHCSLTVDQAWAADSPSRICQATCLHAACYCPEGLDKPIPCRGAAAPGNAGDTA